MNNHNNIEAERGTILCLLNGEPSVARVIFNTVAEQCFSCLPWRIIYNICNKMYTEGRTISRSNVLVEVEKLPEAKHVLTWLQSAEGGGVVYDMDCERYAEAVYEASKRNALERVFSEKASQIGSRPTNALISECCANLEALANDRQAEKAIDDAGEVARVIAKDCIEGEPRTIWGHRTGIAGEAFDLLTGGLQPSTLWVITGTTGLGKSMLALSIVAGCKRFTSDRPLIISTEMYTHAITRRLLAIEAGVAVDSILQRTLSTEGKERVQRVIDSRKLDGITVCYFPGYSVDSVTQYALKHKKQYGLPVMLIDLMEGLTHGAGQGEYETLTNVCRGINERKGQLATCILGVVQQNAQGYTREDRTSQDILGCIKGTGQFRQDADKVIGLVRREDGTTDIWQAKDRDPGNVGKINVEWLGAQSTYRLVDNRDEKDWRK